MLHRVVQCPHKARYKISCLWHSFLELVTLTCIVTYGCDQPLAITITEHGKFVWLRHRYHRWYSTDDIIYVVTERACQARVMEPVMQKPSLDQILATIPPPKRMALDQKVSDIHLAEIARAVICWRSVCTHLGITEGEEAAIEGNIDVQRYANCSSLQTVHYS